MELQNGSSNIKDSSTEGFQLQMAVLHQSICISKAGHSSLKHVRAEIKDKKPDVSDFDRNVGVWFNFKLNWLYVSNTAIAKFWNFSRRFQLHYEISLPILNTFTVDSEKFSLDANYKLNDANAWENL